MIRDPNPYCNHFLETPTCSRTLSGSELKQSDEMGASEKKEADSADPMEQDTSS